MPERNASDLENAEPTAEEIFEQKAVRLQKRDRLNASGEEAYPVSVPITATIAEVRDRYPDLKADTKTGATVGIAGRVVHLRNGGKLCFAALQAGNGERIQAMISLAEVGQERLDQWKEFVDLGDHVFVAGEVISSKSGELSVLATEWKIASKAVLPLPNLHSELSDESRVRSRYLDLIVREQARVHRSRAGRGQCQPSVDVCQAWLSRSRDADAAGHARRRVCAAIRHQLQRFRHRSLPSHRARAFPQAGGRRRHRARVRDQPQLPQRGRRLDALSGVRDARGVPGLRRLQPDGRPHARVDSGRGSRRFRFDRRHVGRRHGVRPGRDVGPRFDVRVALGGGRRRDHARDIAGGA